MQILIRAFDEQKDCEELKALLAELQYHIAALDPLSRHRGRGDFDEFAYLEQRVEDIRDGKGMAYIAEDDGKPIGVVLGCIVHTDDNDPEVYPHTNGMIKELFIHPAYRRKQVGQLLMQQMEEYFWQKNCSSIRLECFGGNEEAYHFYRKLGYTVRTSTMIKTREC